jgi:putative endonuclease
MIDKHILGQRGELLAKNYLIKLGYKIIANNYRLQHLELDLITKYKNKTIFIEVKTRTITKNNQSEVPLSKEQTKNLKRAINKYCFQNYINPESTQLDLILVLVNKLQQKTNIKHYHDILY